MLAALAADGHGVVTRRQLLDAGLSSGAITRRLRSGALLREHPGVYRVGHRAPSTEARYLAAVWACGEGALLSGRAAGHLLGLLGGHPPPPEVTTRTERHVEEVLTHRRRRLLPLDGTVWRGVPVTTAPSTLVDLAAVLGPADLARACHEAAIRFGVTPMGVQSVLARRPNASGAARLRAVLMGDERVALSALERCFLERLRVAELPLPQTNRRVGSRRVDCHWPDRRLIVELDGYRYHSSRYAWEQDRRREREARARGDEFRRYTYGDVYEHPRHMLAELHALLSSHRPG